MRKLSLTSPLLINSHYAGPWILVLTTLIFFSACNEAEDECTESYAGGQLKFSVSCNLETGEYEGEMRMFYEDGTLMAIRQFQDGVEVDTAYYFYEDGTTVKQVIPFMSGYEHGEFLSFYEDGTTQELISYQYGIKHGPAATYYANGRPKEDGFFANNDKYDRWTCFRENGEQDYVLSYYDRELNGPFMVSRESGTPFMTGTFHRNVLDGDVLFYNEEGAIIFKEIWNMGKNNSFQAKSPGPEEAGPGKVSFEYEKKTISIGPDGVSIQ